MGQLRPINIKDKIFVEEREVETRLEREKKEVKGRDTRTTKVRIKRRKLAKKKNFQPGRRE